MPTARAVSTTVSPGAAKASGRGVSAAGALTSGVDSNSNTSVASLRNGMTHFPNLSALRGEKPTPAWTLLPSLLCRHRPGQVFRDLVEEAGGRQPALVGADQQGQVLGHEAGFDGIDADLLQRCGELRQRVVVVELGAMRQPAGPGEDRGDRVGRGLLALLMLAVMPRHRAMGGLVFNRLAVGCQQDRGHQAERAITLCDGVGLHVAVIVLAGPVITALPLHRRGDHVVDQAMFVRVLLLVELGLEFLVEDLLEDVLEAAVIGLEDGVLRRE